MAYEDLPDARTPGADGDEEARLELVMQEVPRGALVLSASAVLLMMLCWFAIYLFVFLPRGSIG